MSDNYQATFAAPLTRAELEADNPYVPQFEFLQESDASQGIKVGPGYWNDLPYLGQSGIKVYRATLTQDGGDAPEATVLENTLGGTLVWSRVSNGSYQGTLVGAFPDATKVFTSATYGSNTNDPEVDGIILSMDISTDVASLIAYTEGGVPADMKVHNASIEILVYP